jgi:hypothetical protein
MDVSDASYYIFNEKGNKGCQMGHTKKFKKKKDLQVVAAKENKVSNNTF